ncbi:hypothetical protein KAW50_02685 [candidate division WOR-3 bacterium]|nr:hypothetical protein [candidate division WOR-3 bacterium]
MKSLIIGAGQVGKALFYILRESHEVVLMDRKLTSEKFEIIHICFPYSNKFVSEVKRYKKHFKPKYLVIHSTVPLGTSKKCNAFFSPVRGIHPRLNASLLIFIKYLAPYSDFLKKYFEKTGMKIAESGNQDDLEALKLWSTTQYGLSIVVEKEIYKYCKKHRLSFDLVYKDGNKTYNKGYSDFKMPNVLRPILEEMEGKIGGHCVIPNCKLLDSTIARLISRYNKKL